MSKAGKVDLSEAGKIVQHKKLSKINVRAETINPINHRQLLSQSIGNWSINTQKKIIGKQ